jgi:chemotaxis protein histidine kinase CheA
MTPESDDEPVQDCMAKCREHLGKIENDLLAIEQRAADIDERLVNQVFGAAHSIKSGAPVVLRDRATSRLTILDDILDWSKIDVGKRVLEKVDFSLRPLVESIT